MCPVALPAGAEPPPRPNAAATAEPSPATFTRAEAARILSLAPSELRRWERVLSNLAGVELGSILTLPDLVGLAVLSMTVRCLGEGADAFAIGQARVFDVLRDRADIERLDGYVALVGRDSARIAERYDNESCAADDTLVIPLRPILADFRSQAFA